MIFQFHTLYTFDQIKQIATPHYPTHPGLIVGLPNHVAVIGPEYEQYDFCGVDEEHLVLVWVNGPDEIVVSEVAAAQLLQDTNTWNRG